MAITKTVFTAATLGTQAPEVLAWLQANAADYFDSITYDEGSLEIKCSVGDKTALTIKFSGSYRFNLLLANGTTVSSYASSDPLDYGIVTDNGIIIHYNYPTGTTGTWLFITKSDSDSLIMAAMFSMSSYATTSVFYAGDFFNSPAWSNYFGQVDQNYV